MNALTTTGGGFALVPQSMREAMDLANMMAKGRLVPQALQEKPADCLLVIEQACRWGMSPFAVAQEVSVIQGRLMHSGKIVAAAVQSSGALSGRLNYAYTGEGDERTVIVRGTRRGETEPLEVAVRLRDARTNNQHWTKSPDQMLAYHGARVWARRFVPEVMLGVYSPEEFDEPAPEPPPQYQQPRAPMPSSRGPIIDQPREEAKPAGKLPVLSPDGEIIAVAPGRWVEAVRRAVAKLEDAGALGLWEREMAPLVQSVAENGHPELVDAFNGELANRWLQVGEAGAVEGE